MSYRTYMSIEDYPTDYDDISYEPDNMEPEEEAFSWEDFVREAYGNLTYAHELASRADWAYPSTMIDEDFREGYLRYDEEEGTLDIIDEETGEPAKACYDRSFFDPETGRMLFV